MSEDYALKIRHWLISAMALVFALIVNFNTAYVFNPGCNGTDYCAGVLGEALFPFLNIFPILSFWHLFDFIQRRPAIATFVRQLTGIGTLWSLAAAISMILALLVSGRFTSIKPCGGSFIVLFQSCYVPSPLLVGPYYVLTLLMLVLVALKAVIAVRSVLWNRR